MVLGFAAMVSAFFDTLGNAATPEARRVLERAFASALHPWLRLTDPRALTVAHGDAHAMNFLFPRAVDGPAYVIDWQLWHLDLGARDVAFFVGLQRQHRGRHALELPLIRHYLAFYSRGIRPQDWPWLLDSAVTTYRDLECDDLL